MGDTGRVHERADTVVWLDLPRRIWLPRLVVRTMRRGVTREELWNGNRETLRGVFAHPDGLIAFALRTEHRRRQRYPRELGRFRVARLRSPREVDAFLRSARRSVVRFAPASASRGEPRSAPASLSWAERSR